MSRRILVTGSRNGARWGLIRETLQAHLRPGDTVVHGGAPGVDAQCEDYAQQHGISTREYRADWKRHGRYAGPLRNQRMVDSGVDLCLAFPGGAGTRNCIRCAREAGVEVIRVRENEP